MEPKKLTEEEVSKLKNFQSEFQNLVEIIGNVEIQIMDLELKKEELKQNFNQLKQQELTLAKELKEKYGEGSISLETNEFFPTQ